MLRNTGFVLLNLKTIFEARPYLSQRPFLLQSQEWHLLAETMVQQYWHLDLSLHIPSQTFTWHKDPSSCRVRNDICWQRQWYNNIGILTFLYTYHLRPLPVIKTLPLAESGMTSVGRDNGTAILASWPFSTQTISDPYLSQRPFLLQSQEWHLLAETMVQQYWHLDLSLHIPSQTLTCHKDPSSCRVRNDICWQRQWYSNIGILTFLYTHHLREGFLSFYAFRLKNEKKTKNKNESKKKKRNTGCNKIIQFISYIPLPFLA